MPVQDDAAIIDGPVDSTCDISHLSVEMRRKRREQYDNYFRKRGHLKTAAGQDLDFDLDTDANCLDWVEDGNVSVATKGCDLCSEINACRPEGTAPFPCIVRARPRSKRVDGTSVCALCRHVRRLPTLSQLCRARGGKDPASLSAKSKKRRRAEGSSTRAGKGRASESGDGLDDDDSLFGSELSEEYEDGSSEEEYSASSYHRRLTEEENGERLQNWNTPLYVDKSLLQSSQKQHRRESASLHTTLPTSTSASASTSELRHVTPSSLAGPSPASANPYRSRHSLPASSATSRNLGQATFTQLESDQESVDVPLSHIFGGREVNRRTADNIADMNSGLEADGDCSATLNTSLQYADINVLCQRQSMLLKDLQKESRASSSIVDELVAGQAQLSNLCQALRVPTPSNGLQTSEHHDLTTIDGMSMMIKEKEKELLKCKATYKIMLQKEIEKCC